MEIMSKIMKNSDVIRKSRMILVRVNDRFHLKIYLDYYSRNVNTQNQKNQDATGNTTIDSKPDI